MHRMFVLFALGIVLTTVSSAQDVAAAPVRPVPIIFDTDMGNDVDDALALGVIHALETRGECRLLAVTLTKDNRLAAPYVDLVNTFYGRGEIPIGVVKGGKTPEDSKFCVLAEAKDGDQLRYPHDLTDGNAAPEATEVLRKALVGAEDHTVVIAQVGFSTNLARLLESKADAISPLSGMELVTKKVRLLSTMAGAFAPIDGKPHPEYNVVLDIPAAKAIASAWPTPVVYSGFEIGLNIPYPAASIERDFAYVKHHPLAEAYQLYEPTPHERPTWDLTSVLWAIRPERGYFGISTNGNVAIDEKGFTTFTPEPAGNRYYLTVTPEQITRTREALAILSSEPPKAR